jgi:hypothetical protein
LARGFFLPWQPTKLFLVYHFTKIDSPVKWSNPMKRQKYHDIASELLVAMLDEIAAKSIPLPKSSAKFAAFTDVFEDLVADIHDDRRWPDRPPMQISAEVVYLKPVD